MKIDWNPNDSPVFRWFTAHVVAVLALAVANPDMVHAVAGAYAPVVTSVLGIAAATGVLGIHYSAAQGKAVAVAVAQVQANANIRTVVDAVAKMAVPVEGK